MAVVESGQTIEVRTHPRARRDAVAGLLGQALKVDVAAPPEDGRANEAAVRVLAEFFGVHRSQVELVSGASSRNKRFRIVGLTAQAIASRIAGLQG